MRAAHSLALLVSLVGPMGAGFALAGEERPEIRVSEGESIAAALVRAAPGTTIVVEPGVYREALTVDTPDITLRGLVRDGERPVLEGENERFDAAIVSGSPFAMRGFRIQNYLANGVTTQGVRGVRLEDLVIRSPGIYGMYPIQAADVEIRDCDVSGARDAGIYVGQSRRVRVAGNRVHGNVVGIQIENTHDARVADNHAEDNAVGILIDVEMLRIQKGTSDVTVTGNRVEKNNHRNFGAPHTLAGRLASGIGVLVLGADGTVVRGNAIRGNRHIGIGLLRIPPEEAARDPAVDPLPDRNRIGQNALEDNGAGDGAGEGWPGIQGSVVWDGSGRGNCTEISVPSRPGELPECGSAPAK